MGVHEEDGPCLIISVETASPLCLRLSGLKPVMTSAAVDDLSLIRLLTELPMFNLNDLDVLFSDGKPA